MRDDKEIARDASLASRAEELARDMLQESASLQRARMQRHWADDNVLGRDNWLGARRAEAVEQEGAAHRFGFRLESILAETRERGVHIKDWAVDRWGADDLRYWAKALLLIAGAARAGKLEGRTLRVSWHEQVLGTADELKKHDEERHRP